MLKSKKPEIVSTDTKRKRKLLWKSVWNHRELYLLMLPAVIVIILFTYVPMTGVLMAFQNVKLKNPVLANEWVGLRHFERLFSGYWFPIALKNTILVSVLQTIGCWPFHIILALLLHNATNNKKDNTDDNLYAIYGIYCCSCKYFKCNVLRRYGID